MGHQTLVAEVVVEAKLLVAEAKTEAQAAQVSSSSSADNKVRHE
jgi:hypothetical protein